MKATPAKRCEECGKVLAKNNESMLCNYHLNLQYREELKLKRRRIKMEEKQNDNNRLD